MFGLVAAGQQLIRYYRYLYFYIIFIYTHTHSLVYFPQYSVGHISIQTSKALQSTVGFLSGFSPSRLATRLFRYSEAERRMHLGSRQFHYTESSCFSSASRPLCPSPSTESWKHGTNNIMCYSNFAPGLVIRPSAATSVADRADVPASVPASPRLRSLKLSRLHDHSRPR